LVAAARIAAATGAKIIGETFPTRLERGAGLPPLDPLGYLAEFATAQLAGARHLVLVDTKGAGLVLRVPREAELARPEDCEVHVLANGPDDAEAALEQVADAVGAATADAALEPAHRPDRPTGRSPVPPSPTHSAR